MSSWTLKTYKHKDLLVEYEWDKYAPHYVVSVHKQLIGEDFYRTLSLNRYDNTDSAKRSYKLQVKRVKGGYYD